MATKDDNRIALLSIKPVYVDQIERGLKRVEFRKKIFKQETSIAVIYCSSPTQKIVGFFEIAGIDQGTPDSIWDQHASVAGISKTDYKKYFYDSDRAYAICIQSYHKLKNPIKLSDLNPKLTPPQNYRYLDKNDFSVLTRQLSN